MSGFKPKQLTSSFITMKLIYATNIYYERYQIRYLLEQYRCYQRLTDINKEFVLCVTTDHLDKKDSIIQDLKIKLPYEYTIIIDYNWAGNIGSLHKLYTQYKNHIDTCIAFFEEDFTPINNNWLSMCIDYLKDDIMMIGEGNNLELNKEDSNLCTIKTTNDKFIHLNKVIEQRDYHWTDGGFYFSSIEKLQIIEDTIGIFHKGDQITKYNQTIDGIQLGEVGFPTQLYHNNLKFIGLYRPLFFIHKKVIIQYNYPVYNCNLIDPYQNSHNRVNDN
jgi:hypothetical protein